MTEIEPGGREPAPGGLRLVQAFVNTNDIEDGHDDLGSPEQLRAWLTANGLPGGDAALSEADLRKALEVREALRALAATNSGDPMDGTAAETLNHIGRQSPLVVRFKSDGSSFLEPEAEGLAGALARILASVQLSMVEGTWPRFKVCRNDDCRWVFYDHSKNRSGAWCTMAICGDRLKARAYRQRRRVQA